MPTLLPTDMNNAPIPVVRLKASGGAHAISATATSARNTTAFATGTQIVSLYATGPVYVRFGGAGVSATASDHYFPSGVYYDFSLGGDKVAQYTHVAVLRVSTDCDVYVSEKE
jgi:hypothetical protein